MDSRPHSPVYHRPARRYTGNQVEPTLRDRQTSHASYMSRHHYRLSATSTPETSPMPSPVMKPADSTENFSALSSPTTSESLSSLNCSPDLTAPSPAGGSFFTLPVRPRYRASLDSKSPVPTPPRHRETRAVSIDSTIVAPARRAHEVSRHTISESGAPTEEITKSSVESARRYSAMTEAFASLNPRHVSPRASISGPSRRRGSTAPTSARVSEEMELERRLLLVD